MKKIKLSYFVAMAVLLVSGCASEAPKVVGPAGVAPSNDAVARIYVFNISGPTLISQNQKIVDNGSVLVSLPRNTYKIVTVSAGNHVLGFQYRKNPTVNINAVKGGSYYIVAGYNPLKSWAFPIAGDPLVIQQISKEEAQALIEQFDIQ